MKESLTEDEHIAMVELKNEFWRKFSKLVNATLKKAPAGCEDYLELMLSESSSVYGRDTKA